jgi:hypothetical protein
MTSESEEVPDSATIAAKGPAFWEELVQELKKNTDALHLRNLSGNTALMGPTGDPGGEQTCRIEVVNPGVDTVHTDLFYIPGSSHIRRWTPGNPNDMLQFAVLSGGAIGIVHGTDPGMTASHMAQEIVKGMADNVLQQR